MLDLFCTGRHLFFAATIDDGSLLGIETNGSTYGINSGIPTTDDGYTLPT